MTTYTGQGYGVGQVDGGGHVTSGQLSQVQGGRGGHVAGAVVGGHSGQEGTVGEVGLLVMSIVVRTGMGAE